MENKYIFEPKMGSHKLEGIAFVLTNVLTENQKPLKINDLKGFFRGTSSTYYFFITFTSLT
jgi:hypothetical protein